MRMLTTLVFLLAALFVMAGCGGGDEASTQADQAEPATEAAPAEAVATHDCAGGCGMKAVPEDKMTEVGGQWFCAGCVDKAKEAVKKEVDGHG